jgi:putative heme-binding domain-containing protein
MSRLAIFVCLLVLSTAPRGTGQESATVLVNPFNSDADRVEGERTFLSQCASCHGRDGRGSAAGTDLTTGTFRRASSDEGVFQIINKGIPGTGMPGIQMDSRSAWQLVAYLRVLLKSRNTGAIPGDAARGAALFRSSGCVECHRVNDVGGDTGPDLSFIGSRRALREIRQSITEPQASVSSEYWRLRISAKDGRSFTGRRLNEDTFSVQFRDESGALRSLAKSALAQYEIIRSSPMPTPSKLTASDIEDLTAWLASRVIK